MKFSEKLKLIRKLNNLTQAEFAKSIGVSRGNIANIEIENVAPTPMFINCVALTYHVDKNWLQDDTKDDLSALNESSNMIEMIMRKYGQLDDRFKKFVENQINELLLIQGDFQRENSGEANSTFI